ncbi:hypothetical protein EGW08_021482, partial [Elysia chlorotica]
METVLHPAPAMLFSMLTTTWHFWVLIGPHFPTSLGMGATNSQLMRIHNQSQLYHLSQSKGARITNSNTINTYYSKDDSIFFKPKTKRTSRSNESKHFMSSNFRDSKGNDNLRGHVNQDILFNDDKLSVENVSHSKKKSKNYMHHSHDNIKFSSTSMQQKYGTNNSSSYNFSSVNNKTQYDQSHASFGGNW